MAIFSQKNKRTAVDFRNYDFEEPNRCVPFSLPKEIEFNTINLMKDLDLNIGTIDFIVTNDNKYIFLEVNPDGIFEDISEYCNFHLEESIANFLMKTG